MLVFLYICLLTSGFFLFTDACPSKDSSTGDQDALKGVSILPRAGTVNGYARCNNNGLKVCRVGSCKTSEIKIPNTNFASLGDCEDYSGYLICTVGSGEECRSDIPGCTGMARTAIVSDSIPDATFTSYDECTSQIGVRYFRCTNSATSTTTCRSKCETGEEKITITSPSNWTSLARCQAQLYRIKLCYSPKTEDTAPYYEIRVVYDTDRTQTCTTNEFELTEKDFFLSASSKEEIAALKTSYYNDTKQMVHHRCQLSASTPTPVCRPVYPTESNTCPTNEIPLTNTGTSSWPTLAQCNANRYFSFICYDKDSASIDCQSDCGSNAKVAEFGASDIGTAWLACQSDTSLAWRRCRKTATNTVVCRPKDSGCVSGTETELYPSGDSPIFLSRFNCSTVVVYISCYDKTSSTNMYLTNTPFRCQSDSDGCPTNYVQTPSGIDNIFTPTACPLYMPDKWVRCTKTGVPDILVPDIGLVACRPKETGCNADETDDSSGEFPTVRDCLKSSTLTAYCRCKSSSGSMSCADLPTSTSLPCCPINSKQIPNTGTFYDSQENCGNGSFN